MMFCLFCCLAIVVPTSGCGSGSSLLSTPAPVSPTAPATPGTAKLKGKVRGGQQPIQNAEVRLFVAGAQDYGMGATLLIPPQYTDANGDFALTGNYTCPNPNSMTYVVATGGNPGTGNDNPAIALMAAIGSCSSLSTVPSILINEVTTVSAAWALAPFLGADGQLGTSAGDATGLSNAFATVNNLVNPLTGATPGKSLPAGAEFPAAKINTLADILATCVNSSGPGPCGMLFSAATPPGGTAPANTLDAAVNIARNPSNQAAALFNILTAIVPFEPTLAAAPPDWTLAITYTGGGLDDPASIAIDAAGNLWVVNYFSAVSEFSNTGYALSPAAGFTGGGLNESYGIAVNVTGTVWVTNEISPGTNNGVGSLTVLSSAGKVLSGSGGYSGGGVFFPISVAVDTDGSVWTANFGNSSATKMSSTGKPLSGSAGFGRSQLEGPAAVAIDANHNAWFANQSVDPGSVTSISADGSTVNTIDCCGEASSGIATDAIGVAAKSSQGHVWIANTVSSTVSELELNNDGTATVVSTGYSGGGLNHPTGIAVDGAGNIWLANHDGPSGSRGKTVTVLEGAAGSNPGKPLCSNTGLGSDADLDDPFGLAIDESGNVWVANQAGDSVTEFVGAAVPVKTPVAGPAQLP